MDQAQNPKHYGKLVVSTTAAFGAIPIRDAFVSIRIPNEETGSEITHILMTGIDGLTDAIEIETPSPAESLSPGGKKPFTEVDIEVSADGYYRVVSKSVPISPGITSIQPVRMIPIPESEDGKEFPNDTIVVREGDGGPNL